MKSKVLTRFFNKVNQTDNCWEWTGALRSNGYGEFWDGTTKVLSHRFSYETFKGLIPEKLTIDHLCRNRRCVNPEHLEAITRGENVLRGEGVTAKNVKKTHCPKRHEYSTENTTITNDGFRRCKLCHSNEGKLFRKNNPNYLREWRKQNA